MKARFGSLLILPAVVLLLALALACGQSEVTPTPEQASPLPSAAQAAKPLTATERQAIAEFVEQQQAVDELRAELYQEFDGWRSGLTECHPSAAQTALQGFAASFKSVTDQVRNLPRKTSTKELADLLIPAVEAEEAAFRQLRDRWQPGNASLFETLEQRRAEAARAQEATEDRSLELQEEFEEGPTMDDIEHMEEFFDLFLDIEDAWDDYHDAYDDLAEEDGRLTTDELIVEYGALAELLAGIVEMTSDLDQTDDNEDFIEALEEAAEAEQDALAVFIDALTALAEGAAPENGMEGQASGMEGPEETAAAGQPALPMGTPAAPGSTEGPAEMGAEGAGAPSEFPLAGPEDYRDLTMLQADFDAAVEESQDTLVEVEQGIEEFVEDKSAEYLIDVQDFDTAYGRLVRAWESFHEEYDDWRSFDGGCDRIEALQALDGFSGQAAVIAGEARGLPRTGFLLSAYSLLVEAAEREEGAMRALYNSWRPFAIDAFAAVDQERANADRLRQQANTSLQELRARP